MSSEGAGSRPGTGPALVVLAAGIGRRFGGVKQIAPIGPSGETLLDYSVYDALQAGAGTPVRLAMRSSAVGEDSQASFAGQYQTSLNVTRENILTAYKEVVASKYSPRAILYRLRYGS